MHASMIQVLLHREVSLSAVTVYYDTGSNYRNYQFLYRTPTCLYLVFLLRYAFSNSSLGTALLLLVLFIPSDLPKGENQYLLEMLK